MPRHYNNLSYKQLRKIIPIYLKHCTIERGFSPKTVKNKRHCLYRLLRFNRSVRLSLESLGKYTEHLHYKEWSSTSLKKGVPLQIVSRLMRHSNVGITDKTYSHYLLDDLSRVLEKHPLIEVPGKVY